MQLTPDPIIRPIGNLIVGRALQVEAADAWRAHALERKTACMVGIDKLIAGGCGVGQDTKPGEWIVLLVDRNSMRGQRSAGNTMEAIAARNVIAGYGMAGTSMPKLDIWLLARDCMQADIVGLKHDLSSICQSCGDQVLHELLLPVYRNRPATCQLIHIDTVALATELEVHAMVHKPLATYALTQADCIHQIDCTLFKDARADTTLEVLAVATLNNDRLNSL